MLARRTFRKLGALVALGMVLGLSGQSAKAAISTYFWAGSAGATWNTQSTFWSTPSVATPWDSANGSSSVADFNTVGGSASVSGTVNANGIIFDNTAGIGGGTINFLGTSPKITVNATGGTIGSALTGLAGLTTTGTGILTLTGAGNAITGGVNIAGGTTALIGNSVFSIDALAVAQSLGPATLNIQDNASVTVTTSIFMGNQNQGNQNGTVNQSGGSFIFTATNNTNFRIGHWASETSTYNLSAGTLKSVTSLINVGWDGTGIFNQSGGVNSALGLSIPASGHTGNNISAYNLTGGQLLLGSSGIVQGSGTGTLNLGGGTVTNTTAGTIGITVPAVNFTGINGNVNFNAGSGTITVSGAAAGTGGLTVGGGVLFLSNTNGTTFSGPTTIASGGTLQIGSPLSLQNSTLTLASSGGVLNLNGKVSAVLGGLAGDANMPIGLSSLTVGGANASTVYSGVMLTGAGSFTKVGTGTLTLAGNNSYSGTTTIAAGTLRIDAGAGGALNSASPLAFAGAGTFIFDNTTASGVVSQAFPSLTIASGEATVQSTRTAPFITGLNFGTSFVRAPGRAVNFVVAGSGVNGIDNSIVLTGQSSGFIDQGTFFDGNNYAWYDAAGFVRGINYVSPDPGASTVAGGASLAGTYVQTTGPVTAQTTTTLATLNIAGANNITFLNASQVLTVNGILKSGNSASSISGGAIQAATNGELVIRADQAGDGLTINSPILANGTSGLTKAGQGTLTLAASDNYTGVTIAAAGSLVLANSAALQMSTFDTSGAGLLNFGGFTAISFGGLQGSGNLILANSASSPLTLTVGANNANTALSGILSGGGGLTKIGAGVTTLTGNNTYGGNTSISSGTLQLGNAVVNGTMTSGSYSVASGTKLYLNYATAATPAWAKVFGSGTVELNSAQAVNGSANWGTLALPSGFTGTLQLDNGRVNGTPANLGGAANVILNNGSQLLAFDGTANGLGYNFPENFSINGMGWGESGQNNGAIRESGMFATFSGQISLAGNSGLYSQTGRGGINASGVITGPFALSIFDASTGPIVLSGTNTFTGGTNLASGTLVFANTTAVPATGVISAANGTTLGAGWAIDQTFFPYLAAASLSNTFTVALGTSNANNLDFSSATGANLAFASLGAYANSTYTGTLTPNNNVYRLGGGGATLTFGSVLSDGSSPNALVINGPGMVVLNSGLGNTFAGGTTITGGTLNINSDSALGTAPSSPATNVTFAGSSTLQAGAAGIALSANRNIALANGATATIDTNSNNMSIGGAISGSGSLTKIGNGALTLANTESYSGSTRISAGQLVLDFSQATSPANNIVPSTSALTMAGGSLAIIGNASLANSQTFNGTAFSAGANTVNASSGTNALALGAITRSVGATVDFLLPSVGSITTTTSNASPNATILGGYATTGGSTWAVAGGSSPYAIGGLASYNNTFTAGANVDPGVSGSFSLAGGTTAINSLRLSTAGTATVAIGAGNALAISTGGILETAGVGANAVTISGGTLVGASGQDLVVIQNNPSSALTISSVVIANNTSATALTKSGVGTLFIATSANTYTGGTFINGGILGLGNNANENVSSLGTGTVTINPAGTLGFYPGSSGSTFTIPNAVMLNGGKVHVEDGKQHLSGPISVGSTGGTMETKWSTKDLWLDGVLSGSGSLTMVYAGGGDTNHATIHISNSGNTYTGTATLNAATVSVENAAALQFATVNLNNSLAVLSNSANTTLAGLTGTAGKVINADATARTFTVNYNGLTPSSYSGALGDGTSNGNNFALVKSGIGLLNLGGASTYVGGTTVSGGVLQLGSASALGTGNLTVSGAILDLNGNSPTVGAVSLVSGQILGAGATLTGTSFNVQSGAIGPSLAGASASASLTKTSNGLVTLAGANSYGGITTVSAGTLQLLNGASLPLGGGLIANGGLLDLGGYSPTLGQLSGVAGVITDNSAGAGTTIISATSGNFNGAIQNGPAKTIALTMNGPGTLALGGTNTYSGLTNVNGGALLVNGTHTGGDAYMVQGGTFGGAGTISGTNTVTLNFGTAINPGPTQALSSIGTLTLPNLVSTGGATANFDLAGTTAPGGGVNDLVAVTGNLSLIGNMTVSVNPTAGTLASGSAYTLFTYGTLDPASTASGSGLQLAPGLLGLRQSAAFSYGSGINSSIQLTVSGFNANLTWIGTSSTTWDQNNTSNLPWTGAPTQAGDFFATKDNVTFNNSAVATTVNIASTVSPGSVTVTGSKNFIFTGAGNITNGTSVKVLGPGTLTIANTNDYVQGTFIQGGGQVILGTNNGLPIAGTVTLGSTGSNGTLDLAGFSQQVGDLAIGSGATAASQTITSSTGSGNLIFSGVSTTFAGTIQDTAATSGGSLALTVANGLLNLNGSNSYNGGTTLAGGTLQIGAPLTIQNSIVTPAGGALDLGGFSATIGGLSGFATFAPTGGTLNVGGVGVTSEFDGTLDGSLPLVKVGSGTFTMTGNNTYTAATTVTSGVLAMTGNNNYTGVTTVSGGTLQVNNLANGLTPSAIGASSNLRSNLVLNGGVFQYTGATVNTDRGFTVGASGGSIDIADGTQVQFGNSLALGGTLTTTDAGTLRFINYTGSTVSNGGMIVINQGTVDFGGSYFNASPFGFGALNIQVNPGGDLLLSNAHALGGDNVDAGTSWGVISILGGTMTLDREQYIHGGTVNGLGRLVLSAGTVNVGTGQSQEFRDTTNTSEISTLASAQPSVINVGLNAAYSTWMLDVAHGTAPADLVVNGNVYGGFGITKVNNGSLQLTGSDTYTGDTTVNGGTLQVGSATAIPYGAGTGNVALGGSGTFDLFGNTTNINGLSGAGSVDNSASSAVTLDVGNNDATTAFSGLIENSNPAGLLALTKVGSGTLTLSGTGTYLGGTTVNDGTLIATNSRAIQDGTSLSVGDPSDLSLLPAAIVPAAAIPSVASATPAASSAIAPVPEPGTLALIAAVLGSLAVYRRMHRR